MCSVCVRTQTLLPYFPILLMETILCTHLWAVGVHSLANKSVREAGTNARQGVQEERGAKVAAFKRRGWRLHPSYPHHDKTLCAPPHHPHTHTLL